MALSYRKVQTVFAIDGAHHDLDYTWAGADLQRSIIKGALHTRGPKGEIDRSEFRSQAHAGAGGVAVEWVRVHARALIV